MTIDKKDILLGNEADVKTSELHGLSQRGGSVETHQKIIPLNPSSILRAIEKIVPEEYVKEDKRVFELTQT